MVANMNDPEKFWADEIESELKYGIEFGREKPSEIERRSE